MSTHTVPEKLVERMALHEVGHVVGLLHYRRSIEEIFVNPDGTGRTVFRCGYGDALRQHSGRCVLAETT